MKKYYYEYQEQDFAGNQLDFDCGITYLLTIQGLWERRTKELEWNVIAFIHVYDQKGWLYCYDDSLTGRGVK